MKNYLTKFKANKPCLRVSILSVLLCLIESRLKGYKIGFDRLNSVNGYVGGVLRKKDNNILLAGIFASTKRGVIVATWNQFKAHPPTF